MDQAVHGQKGDTGEMTVAYAAYHQDRDIRMTSSSGGVFYALAAEVIRDGGVVFGVRFDNLFHAVCDAAETLEDLIRFQGSKYVYPDLQGVDARIRGFLEQGRTVLFTGLPCHAAGIRGSLMRQGCRTERLICVDVVCHGTPAPGVWESYLRYESERGNGIAGIRMRDKTAGWADYRITITDRDGAVRSEPAVKNIYMRGYVRNLYLRETCYHCRFRGVERRTDLTLGDYWGVSARHRDLDTEKGVSLILAHTRQGEELLKAAAEELVCVRTDPDYACACNPAVVQSPDLPGSRRIILDRIRSGEAFSECVRSGIRYSPQERFRALCRKVRDKMHKRK